MTDSQNVEKGKRKGMPLQTLIIVMILIAGIISFALLYSMYRTTKGYDVMRSATQDYIEWQSSAFSLQEASSYLTEQARSFTVTGDPEKARLYYQEVQVTKRREKAVEDIKNGITDERAMEHLSKALELSDALMQVEEYAMRLVIEANGGDVARYPEPLARIELTENDAALSAEEKMSAARAMMFDSYYDTMVSQIRTHVSLCVDALINTTTGRQKESAEGVTDQMRYQKYLIAGLMLSLLLTALVIFILVIGPLNRQIKHISKDQMLDEEGTSELRFLARTYNEIYAQTRTKNEQLSYEASHDPLTGLYNRSAYDRARLKYKEEDIALILVDIDVFKSINDQYGHDMGDRVLRRVADVLQSSFRGEDMVCRIGGDEFSVIMVHASSQLTELVRGKIQRAAAKLANPTDGLPVVTLSVGVAFADQKEPSEDLFKNADLALYQIKMAGRNGCAFYQPQRTES